MFWVVNQQGGDGDPPLKSQCFSDCFRIATRERGTRTIVSKPRQACKANPHLSLVPCPCYNPPMRVLYLSQYFPPEVGATQTRAAEMSRYLASRGHKVTVVTEVPNHPSGIIAPRYRGRLSERVR